MVLNALNKAFKIAKPQILNSDQGSQFTSQQYIDFVKENGIRQSMDGKSRWADNIMIERWFRSFKYEEAYLTQYNNIKEARVAIKRYVHTYNFERYHSALDYLYHQSILTLNSIMFLLILRQKIIPILIVLFFKFHYVSINSDPKRFKSALTLLFKFHYVSINSVQKNQGRSSGSNFKFHYVSINSLLYALSPRLMLIFKFHYVSINSLDHCLPLSLQSHFKFHYVSINSILSKVNLFISKMSLNSIMFLLIPEITPPTLAGQTGFKFHYVSINSIVADWYGTVIRKTLNSIIFLLILSRFIIKTYIKIIL